MHGLRGARSRDFHLSVHRPEREPVERTCDWVIGSKSLHGKIKNLEVLDGMEPRPRKAVSFLWIETRRSSMCGSSSAQKLCQVAVEVSCHVEARQKEEQKERRRQTKCGK